MSPGPQARSHHQSEWNPDVTKSQLQTSVVVPHDLAPGPSTQAQTLQRQGFSHSSSPLSAEQNWHPEPFPQKGLGNVVFSPQAPRSRSTSEAPK